MTTVVGCSDSQPSDLPSPTRAATCEAFEEPTLIGSLEVEVPRSPILVGDIGYILEDDHLVRIDLTDPAAPEMLPSLRLLDDVNAEWMFGMDEYLVVIGTALTVYEPTPLRLEIITRTDQRFHSARVAHMADDMVYLDDGEWVVDLSDPTEPAFLDEIEGLEGGFSRVWPTGQGLLAAGGGHDLISIGSLHGEAPRMLRSYDGGRIEFAMTSEESRLTFVAAREGDERSLRVLRNAADGTFEELGRTPTKPGILGMRQLGDDLLMFRSDLILVYDVSNPGEPMEVERIDYRDGRAQAFDRDHLSVLDPYTLVFGHGQVDVMSLCEPTRVDSFLPL